MTQRAKKINKAIRHSKELYNYECICCSKLVIDGAHIFPKGQLKYRALATLELNIVPLCYICHQSEGGMDRITIFKDRKPWSRIRWVYHHISSENKLKFKHQMFLLKNAYRELKGLGRI